MALRASLAQRQLPTSTFLLRVFDDRRARAELAAAQVDGDAQRVAEAEQAVQACYEQLAITALPPAEWEALLAAHPATEQQRKDGAWCNNTTFLPALLAACIEGDETEADWADLITKGAITQGEVTALSVAVHNINLRSPDPLLPKG